MAHMAALEVGLPTTREQELLLAGALSMGHTDPGGFAQAWNARTGTYAQTRQGSKNR
jgi:hypothetical protein